MEQRQRELTEAVSSEMIKYVAKNLEEMVFNRSLFVFVDAVYQNCIGDVNSISQGLIDLLIKKFTPGEEDENGHVSFSHEVPS